MQSSTQAVRARTDEPFLERFIQAHEAFVLRCASRHAGFAVTRSDDEYSVALLAFYEAIKGYDPASGPFGAYASLVIGRRLADHYRSQHRFDVETPLAPQTFDGTVHLVDAKNGAVGQEIRIPAKHRRRWKKPLTWAACVAVLCGMATTGVYAAYEPYASVSVVGGTDSVEYTVNRFDQVLGTRVSGREQPPDSKIPRFVHIDKAVEHTVRQEAKEGERVSITVTSRSSGHAERLREHIDDRFRQSGDKRNPPEVRVQPPQDASNAPGESRQSESAEQA